MEENQEEYHEEEDSEYDELLFSPYSDLRLFALNDKEKQIPLMGILVREIEDSFLVGLPAKFTKDAEKGYLRIEEYLPFPYIRLYKVNLLYTTPLFGMFKTSYSRYLKEIALKSNPEFIDILPEDFLIEHDIEDPYMTDEPIDDSELEERLKVKASQAGILRTHKLVH